MYSFSGISFADSERFERHAPAFDWNFVHHNWYFFSWLERNQPNGIPSDVALSKNVLGFHRTCQQHILIECSRCLTDPKKTTIYEYSELNSKSSSRDYEEPKPPRKRPIMITPA